MDHDEIAAVLDVGIAAVRDAGSIALDHFRTDMAIDNKLAGVGYDPSLRPTEGSRPTCAPPSTRASRTTR